MPEVLAFERATADKRDHENAYKVDAMQQHRIEPYPAGTATPDYVFDSTFE